MSSQRPAQKRVQHLLNPSSPSVAVPSSASHPGSESSILIDERSKSLLETMHHARHRQTLAKRGLVTIGMLPDVPLLVIFDCYLHESGEIEAWRTLVHVCRKWRNLVFGSQHRLNLRLICTARRPVREMLDIWPPLPIVILPYGLSKISTLAADNIIAALEHNDRIHHVELYEVSSSLLDKAFAVMQGPFPVLTDLDIRCNEDEIAPVVPNSFLGGFAPRLRKLSLDHIPFPGLSKLLLSASDLTEISLWHIPHSGYISPSAMVDCLSRLDRLESLWLLFESSHCRPDRESRRPPPQTRFVLPSLAHFEFKGASDYLEDFVARINAPLLDYLNIGFFHQPIFDTPQLAQFVSRAPKLETYDEARVSFSNVGVEVTFRPTVDRGLRLEISCKHQNWQLSSLAQVCSASIPRAFITAVEHLYICEIVHLRPHWQDHIENAQWFELLHPFTALRNLYLSRGIVPRMVPALQLEGIATEELPALQNVCLERPSKNAHDTVEQMLSSQGIAVRDWDGETCMWWMNIVNDVEGEWWYGDTGLEHG